MTLCTACHCRKVLTWNGAVHAVRGAAWWGLHAQGLSRDHSLALPGLAGPPKPSWASLHGHRQFQRDTAQLRITVACSAYRADPQQCAPRPFCTTPMRSQGQTPASARDGLRQAAEGEDAKVEAHAEAPSVAHKLGRWTRHRHGSPNPKTFLKGDFRRPDPS